MVIGLWFTQYTWSPHFSCFSKPFTSVRMTRPQTFCQAMTLGNSGWATFSTVFSLTLFRPAEPLKRCIFLPYQIILNKYLSGGQRENSSVVSTNVNSITRMRRSLITEVPEEATWSWSMQGRQHSEYVKRDVNDLSSFFVEWAGFAITGLDN